MGSTLDILDMVFGVLLARQVIGAQSCKVGK
jgi:hypothetical protein